VRPRIDLLYVLAAVLFVATVAYAAITVGPTDTTGLARTASVYDEGPGGAALLRRWLESIGARTAVVQGDRFAPAAARMGVLFMLGATEPLTPADVAAAREYAREGGTLVVATDAGFAEALLLEAIGVRLAGFAGPGEHEAVGIAMASPRVGRIALDQGRELTLGDRGLPIARTARGPIAAMVAEGRGTIVVVGSVAPFLSGQLGEADNGRFALALADTALRSGSVVAFDEYHHGSHPPPDVLAVLQRTWPGRALVAGGLAVFAYLALTGRRLGPPLPIDPRPARSSLDHIRAFAALLRRSGHGAIARDRLRQELRGGLARELGLDPGMPLGRVLAALPPDRAAEAREVDALLARRLRGAELLRTVRRVDRLLHPRTEGEIS